MIEDIEMAKLSLGEALEIVKSNYDKRSRSRRWFTTPIRFLASVIALEEAGVPIDQTSYKLIHEMQEEDMAYDIPVQDVTNAHMEAWERFIEDSPSPRRGRSRGLHTIDSYKRAMRSFWNHLIRMHHVRPPGPHKVLSFDRLPEPDPKHLENEQIERLRAVARRDLRDHAIIEVLRASGIRVGGLASMKVSAIQFEKRCVKPEELPPGVQELVELAHETNLTKVLKEEYLERFIGEFEVVEKGNRGRKQHPVKFLDHDACVALQSYIQSRPTNAPDALWLHHKSSLPLSSNGIYDVFKTIAEAAGVDCSPHSLRHTFAHRLIYEYGVDIRTAADLLGHRDPMTTLRIYHKNTRSNLRKRYDEIHRNIYGGKREF